VYYEQNGTELISFDAYRKQDVFPVSALLEAAGVHLEDMSDRVVRPTLGKKPTADGFNTFRDRGMALMITITYENTKESC
jgi:hypothetical protein